MTKKISLLILTAVIFAALMCFTSCSFFDKPDDDDPPVPPVTPTPPEEPEEPEEDPVDLSGISLPDLDIVYDGRSHSVMIEGTLPEGVTVGYLGNGVKNAGEYSVTARFFLDGAHLEDMDMTATIRIRPASYDTYGITFDDAVAVYSGSPFSLRAYGVPSGVTVVYDGNGVSAIGEHTVTANFVVDENHEEIEPMEATISIVEGDASFAGVCITNSTYIYDGTQHSLTVGGHNEAAFVYSTLPSGTNAGVYSANVLLTTGAAELILPTKLTIKKAKLNVSAKDTTVEYDGREHSVSLDWGGVQPVGVVVSALGNSTAVVGSHNVRFRFSLSGSAVGNYLYQPDINVTLTIEENEDMSPTEGLEYVSVSGGYAVSGYSGSATAVLIPKEHTNSLGVKGRVLEISSGAFMGNTSITSVCLPDSITRIGHNAFRGCTSLSSVNIGSRVGAIGQLAFAETAVRDVVLPDSLKAIGQGAFRGCSVERITLPFIGGSTTTSNPFIGYIFGAIAYAGNEQFVPETLTTVVLSDKCTIVPAYSFFGADSIEEVIVGSGVREIGISAFQGCTSLIGLYVPSSVTDVPAAAKNYNSPVWGCSEGFEIGTGYESKEALPDGFGIRWDVVNDTSRASVLFGLSYEEYLSAVRTAKFFE